EADRDRGRRVLRVCPAERGTPQGRRPQGTGRRPARARPRRARLPGRGEGRARARHVGRPAHARVRPGVSRRSGAGFLRRGEGAARRSRRVVSLTGRAGLNGHATVLLVDDVHRATAYYRDRLGFEVGHYDQNPSHYAYAERDGCRLHFARFEGATPRPNCREAPPDMFDAYFWVDDVDALYAELAERGAELHGRPELQGYGMYDFRVADPHGYVLAFGRAGSGEAEPESA